MGKTLRLARPLPGQVAGELGGRRTSCWCRAGRSARSAPWTGSPVPSPPAVDAGSDVGARPVPPASRRPPRRPRPPPRPANARRRPGRAAPPAATRRCGWPRRRATPRRRTSRPPPRAGPLRRVVGGQVRPERERPADGELRHRQPRPEGEGGVALEQLAPLVGRPAAGVVAGLAGDGRTPGAPFRCAKTRVGRVPGGLAQPPGVRLALGAEAQAVAPGAALAAGGEVQLRRARLGGDGRVVEGESAVVVEAALAVAVLADGAELPPAARHFGAQRLDELLAGLASAGGPAGGRNALLRSGRAGGRATPGSSRRSGSSSRSRTDSAEKPTAGGATAGSRASSVRGRRLRLGRRRRVPRRRRHPRR